MSMTMRAYAQGYNPWWTLDDDSAYQGVASALRDADMEAREVARQAAYHRYACMYDNARYGDADQLKLRLNLTQAIVDTAAAQIAGQRTGIMTLTKMGDDAMQKRAKKQNMFIEGMFDRTRHYDAVLLAFYHSCIFGTGAERPYIKDASIETKAVHPGDLVVPACEVHRKRPKQLFEVDVMPAYEAIHLWPEHEDLILSSQPTRESDKNSQRAEEKSASSGNLVFITRAWKLPNTDQPEDDEDRGWYVYATDNCTLERGEYTERDFPHCFYPWSPDPYSFWGIGIPARIESVQAEVDALTEKVQDCMGLATTQLWFKKGSAADKKKVSNKNLATYEYAVTPPTVINVPPIEASYFAQIDKLFQRGFDLTGISPMAAQGMKPQGIDSGKALRLYKDITAQRQMIQGNGFDQLSVDVADRMLGLAAQLDAMGESSYKIMAKSGNALVDIVWADVAMDRDSFQLQKYPVSFLSSTPSAKMDDISEFLQTFPELRPFAMKAADFPDVENFTSLGSAPYDEVLACLNAIIEDGEYRGPESQTDLSIAGPLALAYLRRAKANGLAQDRCDLLRSYLNAVKSQQRQRDAEAAAAQAAAQPPPPGPGGPAGPPMALPGPMGAGPMPPPGMPPPGMAA